MTATEKCRYMDSACPTLGAEDCCGAHRHEDRVFTLARAMAVIFQKVDPSDEQVAWFLDDADAVVEDFDPTPDAWEVADLKDMPDEMPGIAHMFQINGVEYVLQDADWEPARPVRLTTYKSWTEEDW